MILNLSLLSGKKGGDEFLEKDSYKTIKSFCSFEHKTQKSRFVALAYPFSNPDDFSSVQAKVKKEFYDSAHIPFAYRVGIEDDWFRFNDDGEPSGSAGKPVLDAIDKYELTDVIVFVARYFGGVKLGVGGLKRAFFDVSEGCLQNAKIIEKFIKKQLFLTFDYKYIGSIMNYIEKNAIQIVENKSDDIVKLMCEVRLSKVKDFEENIKNFTSGNFSLEEPHH
jgi:uncharacterized YigZ family protein